MRKKPYARPLLMSRIEAAMSAQVFLTMRILAVVFGVLALNGHFALAQTLQLKSKEMTFFVTSSGVGKGANLGGLEGADRRCQELATSVGSGNHTWRAYLSTSKTYRSLRKADVHARDRIGRGPWKNARGIVIARDVAELHSSSNRLSAEAILTERGEAPRQHDVLTGSNPNGTAALGYGAYGLNCGNWTSEGMGRARVGHANRRGYGDDGASWNSAHSSNGCGQEDLESTGGAGAFYCFAVR